MVVGKGWSKRRRRGVVAVGKGWSKRLRRGARLRGGGETGVVRTDGGVEGEVVGKGWSKRRRRGGRAAAMRPRGAKGEERGSVVVAKGDRGEHRGKG